MRQPIAIDRPSAKELQAARDRVRTTSLVYEHILSTCGIGEAERWIESMDVTRASDLLSLAARDRSPTHGWILSATAQSERIAKRV